MNRTRQGRKITCVEISVPGGIKGAHVDSSDDTAVHYVHGTRCRQVLELWTGTTLNNGDVGHTLPSSLERVRGHVLGAGLWAQHEDVLNYECFVPG